MFLIFHLDLTAEQGADPPSFWSFVSPGYQESTGELLNSWSTSTYSAISKNSCFMKAEHCADSDGSLPSSCVDE